MLHVIRIPKSGSCELEHILVEIRKEDGFTKIAFVVRFTDGTEATHEDEVRLTRYLITMAPDDELLDELVDEMKGDKQCAKTNGYSQ